MLPPREVTLVLNDKVPGHLGTALVAKQTRLEKGIQSDTLISRLS